MLTYGVSSQDEVVRKIGTGHATSAAPGDLTDNNVDQDVVDSLTGGTGALVLVQLGRQDFRCGYYQADQRQEQGRGQSDDYLTFVRVGLNC